MNAQDMSDLLPMFLSNTEKLDKIRGEDFFKTFPELKSLKKYKQ